jgi:glycosyltransferase involved in cell wall biosynthesis
MRIVFDVSYVQKKGAGIGRYTRELLKALLATDRKNEYVLHGWSYLIDKKSITSFRRENVTLSVSRIPGSLKRFYWNNLRSPSLGSILGAFDIFHGAEPLLPPIGEAFGIITVHDLAYLKFPEFFEKRDMRRDPHIRRSVREAAAIIVPSLSTKADLVEMFGVDEQSIHLVRPPLYDGFSSVRDHSRDDRILMKYGLKPPFALFVGVLEPRKNILAIVRALERFHAGQSVELDLVLVGRQGWLCEGILESIRRSPVRERIHQLSFVPDADLASLYRSAVFFVYPSLYEGFGFPVVEAMTSGLPVITSRNSSLREIAEGAALLVDPHNVDELASAMHELACDDKARDRFAFLGQARIKLLYQESAARRVMRLYDELGQR